MFHFIKLIIDIVITVSIICNDFTVTCLLTRDDNVL